MWTLADIPDQTGRTALITGATSGLGLVVATELRARGATVIVAGRHPSPVARRIGGVPLPLDLADLASVRAAAAAVDRPIDLLVNNAGLMIPPYGLTVDGFEQQFGVNHLGHFALTGLLLDRLDGARVVTVSSNAHHGGSLDFGNLDWARDYHPMRAYRRSKLANLLFAFELGRRCPGLTSVAAHPGAARTALTRHSPWLFRFVTSPRTRKAFDWWLIQSAESGALPILRAATDPAVAPKSYFGPDGWHEFTGRPVLVEAAPAAHDEALAARLWEISQRMTGVCWPARAGMLTDGP
ncbi:oxidoreductase [Paractinoplanes lichenicola]|uniref:SDR family NAD(P)-dependent oxidoreductase n=1 Tax=Paractinoplanes lichenicola TaxID=2802976 RepID=A0ABS1VSQ6_9ACTN|nr:oxidoreductase [Actinoplanes lichenicola]MBL7257311.1 SDR family NAD(P)-dependent oxidoreductase [Actinoplanes lichenicola]